MPSTVTLGPIVFTAREVPDTINFGGKQSLAIHKQLGGSRVVDAMGPDPAPIKWSGRFQGPSASQRARLVDALKDTGAQVRLSWGTFTFNVVVAEFTAVYKHEFELAYEITVEIVSVSAALPLQALQSVLGRDLATASAAPGLSASSALVITAAKAAINTVAQGQLNGNIANASLTALQPAITAVEAAFGAIDGAFQSADGSVSGINLDAITGGSALDGFASFFAEAANVALASNLAIARGYLGRAVGNLTQLGG